jgi:hypothetical protein
LWSKRDSAAGRLFSARRVNRYRLFLAHFVTGRLPDLSQLLANLGLSHIRGLEAE